MPIKTVPSTEQKHYLIAFDADGHERREGLLQPWLSRQVLREAADASVTDVFLLSHGWQGDLRAAEDQYDRWLGTMIADNLDLARIQQERPGFQPLIVGLHWPSLPFGDEVLKATAVGVGRELVGTRVDRYAERIANTRRARKALESIFEAAENSQAGQPMSVDVREAYEVLQDEAGLHYDGVGGAPGCDLETFEPEAIFAAAGEEKQALGIPDRDTILAPLRTLSFWKMKDRARKFGETGGAKLLSDLQDAVGSRDVRFHLMGHSFGCIVVSAMLHTAGIHPVRSLALVQGALSLWAYCSDIPAAPGRRGYFNAIMANRKVTGPIITTQSLHDTAVGKWYPLAAGIARQVVCASAGAIESVGDSFPKYGGVGAWGLHGHGVGKQDIDMLPANGVYGFREGVVYNINADKFICHGGGVSGAHSDICQPEVAHAVWEAIRT